LIVILAFPVIALISRLRLCQENNLKSKEFHTSRPAKGDVLTENDILTVGSSTVIVGSATPSTLSAKVSPIYGTQRTNILRLDTRNRIMTGIKIKPTTQTPFKIKERQAMM